MQLSKEGTTFVSIEMVINALDKHCDYVCEYSKKQRATMCDACPLGTAFDIIYELPSVDVRENVRGEWIDVDPYGDSGLAFKCSECEKISIRDTNYCPNCGADMRANHAD